MGDGGADGPSATGDRGQAAISLMPDVDGMHVRIFESLKLEGAYVGDLLYISVCVCVCVCVCECESRSRVQLCNPMDCSSKGSTVHGILQTRILEYPLESVAIPFSRGLIPTQELNPGLLH